MEALMNDTLKTLRQSKKITQTKASEYLGVSLRTYKTYENDQSKIGNMKYDYMLIISRQEHRSEKSFRSGEFH